jgi:non-ribosomal peptide synthetase component F
MDGLHNQMAEGVSCGLVKITPSHLSVLGERMYCENKHGNASVFVIGGEALAASTIALWREIQPSARFINEFGPTETVVGCIVYEIPQDVTHEGQVPIGRPIANTRVYLLDERRQPVPLGAIGELYIGGEGVARGYLNRAELTAERFVRDPFVADREARMYRTGDLGRYRADGNIEYVGRNDFQVKIRGYRIELGEIEARLREHGQVREAVVEARDVGE